MDALSSYIKSISIFILVALLNQLNAQSAEEWVKLGDQEENAQKAEAYYTKALETNPDPLGKIHCSRAIVRGYQKKYREALDDITIAISVNKSISKYYAQRAFILYQVSEYDDASIDYKYAITLDPNDSNYFSGLSACRLKQNRINEALELANKGLLLNSKSSNCYRNRGKSYLLLGNLDLALDDLNQALYLKHKEPHKILTDIGELYEIKKEYLKSYEYYANALKINPYHYDAENKLFKLIKNGYISIGNTAIKKQATFTGKRIALIIGNSDYVFLPELQEQPIQDTKDIAKILEQEHSFQCIHKTNLNNKEFRSTLNSFFDLAKDSDLALIYFAGHGLQHQGSNYILPININLENGQSDQKIEQELNECGILLATVIEKIQKANPQFGIVMLDACREKPINSVKYNPSPFAPIYFENLIRNCIVAQSTTSGSKAWNTTGRNSIYAQSLLKFWKKGIEIEDLLKNVRRDVMEFSKKENQVQLPEYINQITDELIF